MPSAHNDFLSKINFLSGGRYITPWLESTGLTKATINALRNAGRTPSSDVLRAISRTENASLIWLTEGKGAPFYVAYALSDEDGAELLDALCEGDGWVIAIVTGEHSEGFTLLLAQHSHFEIKGRRVDFTQVEIIAGHLGKATLERAAQATETGSRLYTLKITDEQYERLERGAMGNYELIGWRKEEGLFANAQAWQETDTLDQFTPTADTEDHLTKQEKLLLKIFRRFSDEDKKRLLAIAESLQL
ncbi:hypothetical protein [Candidatus Endoriftia persephonae]|jgi:hypothetical protein|uniref:Transcriptional regulator n=1 Tax=Candidatus Endoriftia persephonae TaxID=393765 RepID=A0A9J7A1D7_9GAMM|nr:hypothetical protein [Candidatus Endoriftia persephone]USF88761.1 transcriptional regulator [Candidatus Endoriftia persephone]